MSLIVLTMREFLELVHGWSFVFVEFIACFCTYFSIYFSSCQNSIHSSAHMKITFTYFNLFLVLLRLYWLRIFIIFSLLATNFISVYIDEFLLLKFWIFQSLIFFDFNWLTYWFLILFQKLICFLRHHGLCIRFRHYIQFFQIGESYFVKCDFCPRCIFFQYDFLFLTRLRRNIEFLLLRCVCWLLTYIFHQVVDSNQYHIHKFSIHCWIHKLTQSFRPFDFFLFYFGLFAACLVPHLPQFCLRHFINLWLHQSDDWEHESTKVIKCEKKQIDQISFYFGHFVLLLLILICDTKRKIPFCIIMYWQIQINTFSDSYIHENNKVDQIPPFYSFSQFHGCSFHLKSFDYHEKVDQSYRHHNHFKCQHEYNQFLRENSDVFVEISLEYNNASYV